MYQSVDFALGQPLDVVWWELDASTGREMTLVQARTWLEQRYQQAAGEIGEPDDDTVVLERTNE